MSKRTPAPLIGEALHAELLQLSESARLHAVSARNYHAMALHVVLIALVAQSEYGPQIGVTVVVENAR